VDFIFGGYRRIFGISLCWNHSETEDRIKDERRTSNPAMAGLDVQSFSSNPS
jgi:hypothetical protein